MTQCIPCILSFIIFMYFSCFFIWKSQLFFLEGFDAKSCKTYGQEAGSFGALLMLRKATFKEMKKLVRK